MNQLTRRTSLSWLAAPLLCHAPSSYAQEQAPASANGNGSAPPLALPNTAVHELVAEGSGRRYPVWVDLPASYAGSDKQLPVVFVCDAPYAFPLVRSIRNLLGQRGRNLEDFVLVGLAYAQGDTPGDSRRRDYTPASPLTDRHGKSDEHDGDHYGEALATRNFLENQVFALLTKHYRVDMGRRVLVGHSYGGLFGAYVLLTKPGLFKHYILSSPSLWFRDKLMFDIERRYAAAHRDLPAQVRLYAGGFETIKPGARYFKETDIVKDMQAFKRTLQRRGYAGLGIDAQVIADEDHFTVFPSAISRGLLWALPGTGPYASG